MIPPFDADGNLPPGIHPATWDELVARFGGTVGRRQLLDGLRRALLDLRAAGCTIAHVDGSFVTAAQNPGDFDGCWDLAEVDLRRLEPTLFDFDFARRAQKRRYGGEMFPSSFPIGPNGESALHFFQHDTRTDRIKGIVAVDVRSLE